MSELIHSLILDSAARSPAAEALADRGRRLDYAALAAAVERAAGAFVGLGLGRGERVAVYLEKSVENVAAMFGAAAAGGVFVPVNPLLKAAQVGHILRDCAVRILVTSPDRLRMLEAELAACPDLRVAVVTGSAEGIALPLAVVGWEQALEAKASSGAHRVIDADMAAILYTSGSTGKPKGVVLSHRNLVAGARSVASYLRNSAEDRILAVLPLSFDYGLSQLTTAFHSGATAVLLNHLLPRDVVRTVAEERITGLAAVPPLWMQLAPLAWPKDCTLRYFTNSGGAMPRATLDALRRAIPGAAPYLMYGLTEAFRSTYLDPCEIDRRPDSIGKAIPNAEVLVVRPDGSECDPDEPGELVHRGALVSLGYWNDPARTAERFKPFARREGGLTLTEMAVWSGDTVRRDRDGYLYFVSRADEMIKTSGYRVSPTEVEEAMLALPGVAEAVAFGAAHPSLGQGIVAVLWAGDQAAPLDTNALSAALKAQLPRYMVPHRLVMHGGPLPRNPNGKIDRKQLAAQHADAFAEQRELAA
ncbi:MAG TPA: acyl-CoA ligase (AMP-forming), exosortase A system-associated [Telluria sp.]|nr:acyl-CoA ligase (AMP-forming), exosortase A system-associated [Telluria sp.]